MLRARGQQIVPPKGSGDSRVSGVRSKDTGTTGLAELSRFIVEVLGTADAIDKGERLIGTEEGGGEGDGVEGHIVLAQEVNQGHGLLLGLHWSLLPPILPAALSILCGDADVADGGVEPDVKDLGLESRDRDGCAPLEIAGHAARTKAFGEPGAGDTCRVCAPSALLIRSGNEFFDARLQTGQVKEEVLAAFDDRLGLAELAARLLQVHRVQQLTTAIALITTSIVEATKGTSALDISISEETIALLAKGLLNSLLEEVAIGVEALKDGVRDGRLVGIGCAPEVIEADLEPVVDAGMQSEILCTNLGASQTLLQGFGLRGRAKLVRTTDINDLISTLATETGIHISAQNSTDNVAQVRNIVNIGQCSSDQSVLLTSLGNPNLLPVVIVANAIRDALLRDLRDQDTWQSFNCSHDHILNLLPAHIHTLEEVPIDRMTPIIIINTY